MSISYRTFLHETELSGSRGATTVEMAIIGVVLFAMLGAIVDFGISFHKYNLISHAANEIARQLAIEAVEASGPDCYVSSLSPQMADRARELAGKNTVIAHYLNLDDGSGTGPFDITARIARDDKNVVVTSSLDIGCFFCGALPKKLTVTNNSVAKIERGDWTCAP